MNKIKFEYKIVSNDDTLKVLEKTLNKLGADGWELISIVPITSDGWTSSERYYFKRRVE